MKNIKHHHLIATILTVVAIIFGTAPLFVAHSVFADTGAQLSLSPSSLTVTQNSDLTLNVDINTNGDSVNAVQSYLTYSTSDFSFVSATAGSEFSSAFPNSETNGNIVFSAGTSSSVNGTATVATIVLKATNTGTSNITLANVCSAGDYTSSNCSAAYDAGTSDNDLSSVVGGTYAVSDSPAAVNSSTNTTPSSKNNSDQRTTYKSNGSSQSQSGSSSTTASSTISLTNLKVVGVTGNSATITWNTSVPSDSTVNFGLSNSLGLSEYNGSLTTNHSIYLGSNYLSRGNTYYFQVSSNASSSQYATSTIQEFKTEGFNIILVIKTPSGKVLPDAQVKLGSQQQITNKEGIASFNNVPEGLQNVVITSNDKTTERSITVGNYKPGTTQYEQQKFTLSAYHGTNYAPYYLIALAALILAAAVIIMSENKWFHKMYNENPAYSTFTVSDVATQPIEEHKTVPSPDDEQIVIKPKEETQQATYTRVELPTIKEADTNNKGNEKSKDTPLNQGLHESPEAGTIYRPQIKQPPK